MCPPFPQLTRREGAPRSTQLLGGLELGLLNCLAPSLPHLQGFVVCSLTSWFKAEGKKADSYVVWVPCGTFALIHPNLFLPLYQLLVAPLCLACGLHKAKQKNLQDEFSTFPKRPTDSKSSHTSYQTKQGALDTPEPISSVYDPIFAEQMGPV